MSAPDTGTGTPTRAGTRYPSLAQTLYHNTNGSGDRSFRLGWTIGGSASPNEGNQGRSALGNGRANITYSSWVPTLGGDQFVVFAMNNDTTDVLFSVQWSDVNQLYVVDECVADVAAASGGYQQATLNILEYLIEAGKKKALALPCASHYVRFGAYSNGAPGTGDFDLALERKAGGGFSEGGL